MEWLTKELLVVYGPLGLGWVYAIWLHWRLQEANKVLVSVVERQIEAMTRLSTKLDERLPQRGGR